VRKPHAELVVVTFVLPNRQPRLFARARGFEVKARDGLGVEMLLAARDEDGRCLRVVERDGRALEAQPARALRQRGARRVEVADVAPRGSKLP
jgi:hypothetical protein